MCTVLGWCRSVCYKGKFSKKYIWRYENKPAAKPGVTLTDINTVTNADFKSAIQWAAGEGITTGYPDGSFRPNAGCTRAHVVTFIYRDMT